MSLNKDLIHTEIDKLEKVKKYVDERLDLLYRLDELEEIGQQLISEGILPTSNNYIQNKIEEDDDINDVLIQEIALQLSDRISKLGTSKKVKYVLRLQHGTPSFIHAVLLAKLGDDAPSLGSVSGTISRLGQIGEIQKVEGSSGEWELKQKVRRKPPRRKLEEEQEANSE